MVDLSANEKEALQLLLHNGGAICTSKIPDKNEPGIYGGVEPGIGVYRKLEKKGLVFFTEEAPIDPARPDDTWTPSVEIEDAGRAAIGQPRRAMNP
jgi:hypothetical protein